MPISIIQSPKKTNAKELSELVKYGIAYIPVPEDVTRKLELIETTGKAYFQQPKYQKKQHPFTAETYEGFLDQTTIGYAVERYIIRASLPADLTWKTCGAEMLELRHYFRYEIIQPLLLALFEHLKIDPKKIQSHFNTADSTLSILYYPPCNTPDARRRLRPHEDAALMTILWSQEPGLEVEIDDKWHINLTKKGYVIVNLGDGLNLMVDNKCHALTHRVLISDNHSRLSIASFYTQDPKVEFINAITGKKIADTFGEYAANHLEKNFPKITTLMNKA
ncbi:MAG: 2OG-Fe(II) oxygenase family protein [Pseudomonadota bacterium]